MSTHLYLAKLTPLSYTHISLSVLVLSGVCFLAAPYRPVKEAPPTVLSSRSNVFDDDEFDVFSRDKVDMSRVWKGRR